ncbi:hypothetical protein DFH09DRAFT_1481950 [Mycena vulgaris]|nr:hypothetical protein DFH09DRAFT_1481950 [Mycena vulgaris]
MDTHASPSSLPSSLFRPRSPTKDDLKPNAHPYLINVTGLAPRWPERKRKSQGLGSPETGVDSTKRTTTNQENIKYSKAVREVTYLDVRGISVMIRHAPYNQDRPHRRPHALHLRLGPRPPRGTNTSPPRPPLSVSRNSKGHTSGGGGGGVQGPHALRVPPGVGSNSRASRGLGAALTRPQPKWWTSAQLAAHLGGAVSSAAGEWAARRGVGGRAYHAHVGGGDEGDG